MNPYLSEKARGEIPRFLKWLRNAGLAFCVFCSVGGLYTLCLDLQVKDTSHVVGYVFWIVVGAVPLVLFARNEKRRYHARTIARRVKNDAFAGFVFHDCGVVTPVTAMASRYSSE